MTLTNLDIDNKQFCSDAIEQTRGIIEISTDNCADWFTVDRFGFCKFRSPSILTSTVFKGTRLSGTG